MKGVVDVLLPASHQQLMTNDASGVTSPNCSASSVSSIDRQRIQFSRNDRFHSEDHDYYYYYYNVII